MKRIFSTILLLLCLSGARTYAAESTAGDTIIRMPYPEKVEIKTNADSLYVKAKGFCEGRGEGVYIYNYSKAKDESGDSDWEVNIPFLSSYRERKNKQRSGVRLTVDWFDNFYVGGLPGIDKPKGMRGGWEIGFDNIVGLYLHAGRKAPVLSLGFGMGYKGINYGGGMMLAQDEKTLLLVPRDEEISSASSRLHLFHLTVPFMITQPLVCGLSARIGAILNLNTYTSATTKMKIGRKSMKESFHSLEQRFATPSFFGSLIYDHVGVYVRWSPVSLYSSEWGPRCKTLSVGVNFVL